jgi:hypothetical protein
MSTPLTKMLLQPRKMKSGTNYGSEKKSLVQMTDQFAKSGANARTRILNRIIGQIVHLALLFTFYKPAFARLVTTPSKHVFRNNGNIASRPILHALASHLY